MFSAGLTGLKGSLVNERLDEAEDVNLKVLVRFMVTLCMVVFINQQSAVDTANSVSFQVSTQGGYTVAGSAVHRRKCWSHLASRSRRKLVG